MGLWIILYFIAYPKPFPRRVYKTVTTPVLFKFIITRRTIQWWSQSFSRFTEYTLLMSISIGKQNILSSNIIKVDIGSPPFGIDKIIISSTLETM